ncbi:hypothetical protein AK812_SmicGene44805, partial [Symbiodinium microadriaticum]
VVLTAVKQNGLAFGMASRLLRSDDGLLLAAVQQNGLALQHATLPPWTSPRIGSVATLGSEESDRSPCG